MCKCKFSQNANCSHLPSGAYTGFSRGLGYIHALSQGNFIPWMVRMVRIPDTNCLPFDSPRRVHGTRFARDFCLCLVATHQCVCTISIIMICTTHQSSGQNEGLTCSTSTPPPLQSTPLRRSKSGLKAISDTSSL